MKAFNDHSVNDHSAKLARRILLLVVVFAATFSLLFSSGLSGAQSPDGRPRRIEQQPAATPTPTPANVPSQTPAPRATATPAPTPRNKTAPVLGDAPPPPKLKPKPTPTPPEETFDPNDTSNRLVINAGLVPLNVRVIDRNNRPIDNVRQNEFHVFEDGVPQPIFDFSREEVPISYGLAVDTSGSLRTQLTSVIDAAKTIINSNKAGDETFLVRFISSDKIETVQDFTSSKDLLLDGMDNLYVEGGQTAIIDAVYLSAEHVAEYKKGDDNDRRRRALILVTDGEDRNSFYKEPQLFQRLREEDVQIYVIGFVNELDKDAGFIRKSPRDKAINLINKLATESGGRAFFPQSLSELPEIARAIVRDLRTQYVISYNPTNKARDGSYRAIRVTVDEGPQHDKRIALTRSGYVAPREGASPVKTPATRTGNSSRPASGPPKSP
jgi:Ca-activated chloride channel family protein